MIAGCRKKLVRSWPPSQSYYCSATSQSWVKIHNRVGGPITVQYASRDDNLGVHVLHNMQQPAWSFDESFFGTTLFWCNFIWQQHRAHVDVWSGGGIWKFVKLCDRYVWDVAPNGFWQSEGGGVGVRWIQG